MKALVNFKVNHAQLPISVISKSTCFKRGFSTSISPIPDLQSRGLLHSVTGVDSTIIEKHIQEQKTVSVYAGFDPTADSLHVGNLITILGLAHFQKRGHIPIALVGGATGMIGDPSGKSKERVLLSEDIINANAAKIGQVLSKCLRHGPVKLVNNYDWYKNMNILAFLRDVGKHFRVPSMLDKESVKNRMQSEEGISFTEFSYQTLQAYDFYNLLKQENCTIQLGGSDQYGNITAGCDLIHKMARREVHGLTVPLLTTSTGLKIGKSEGLAGTVWLSEEKTSIYDFYQYFMRTEDVDVIRFLKVFTFLPLEEIKQLEEEHLKDPGQRIAHKRLAEEVTKFVHGEEGMKKAQLASSILFGQAIDLEVLKKFKLGDIESSSFTSVPKEYLPRNEVLGTEITKLVAITKMSPSRGEAKRTLAAGGLYVNNARVSSEEFKISEEHLIDNSFVLLKVGKRNLKFIVLK